jgi:hypothetical protein
MKLVNERLENGLLKGFYGGMSPETLKELLSKDVEILLPRERLIAEDLWPAVWALAAVLERQVYGRIFIRCKADDLPPGPVALGSRCIFTEKPSPVSISLAIGCNPDQLKSHCLIGDARLGQISVDRTLGASLARPSPIECFALAGYLGFATIAKLVGVPPYRYELADQVLKFEYDHGRLSAYLERVRGFTCLGLGQLGQAFLALLFFLNSGKFGGRQFALVDYDEFEPPNGRTQLLLEEGGDWIGKQKVPYIASVLRKWGADPLEYPEKITWAWKRRECDPPLGLVGLHDFETRRMVCAAGFEELVEAGVGTDLMRPRVTWHRLPSLSAGLGRKLFPDVPKRDAPVPEAPWLDDLRNTPGECGFVEFQGVSATAPCLGAAAAAFAMSELGADVQHRSGSAILWSPCLPVLRQTIISSH